MIKNIPSDLILMLIVGAVFALSAGEGRRRGKFVSQTRVLIRAAAYITAVCIPISLYCYVVAPDWTWMYWADPKTASASLVVIAYLLYYVASAVGYVATWAADRHSKRSGRAVLGVAAAFLLVFWAIFFKRAFWVGGRLEFFEGKAVFLLKVYPLSLVLVITMSIAGVALIGSSLWLSGRLRAATDKR